MYMYRITATYNCLYNRKVAITSLLVVSWQERGRRGRCPYLMRKMTMIQTPRTTMKRKTVTISTSEQLISVSLDGLHFDTAIRFFSLCGA